MKRLFALAPLPLSLLLRLLSALRPDWTERFFSRGVYPFLAGPVSRLMGLCPVPVVELLVAALVGFVLYSVFKKRFFRVFALLGLVASLFLGFWSLNYFRLPLEETLDIPVRASTVQELTALCDKLMEDANALYTEPPEELLPLAGAALNAAARDWPIPAGAWGKPKKALASPLLSRLLIEGITSPFTCEALVNGGIPAVSLPFVACHEAAHVRGFAREEDANLIAYLACAASDAPFYRYSGAVSALLHCLNALQRADGEAYQALRRTLSDGVRADLAAHAAYWAQYRGTTAAEVGARVNDAYLQALGGGDQSARSYGRLVDLLLALERKKGMEPV